MSSDRFSVIECSQNVYAEDVVIQKVIHYISLFHSEVYKLLRGLEDGQESVDELANAIDIAAAEEQDISIEQFEENLEKAAFEEDMEFMMIELDSLSPKLLTLVIDTLERFELYRLSLILCNRYRMHDRNGRFVAAISQKYSNLG